jgi:threonine/homoserine/homoserine lactone efflux protein
MDIPDTNVLLFLGSVIVISLSGVMMPGPVLAATIAKGSKDKNAGLWIGLGHGVVELPLIALIYFGLGRFFENPWVMVVIGVAGGLMLLYIGWGMVKHRLDESGKEKYLPYHPIIVGIITSVSNPYFFLWWATIGLLLVSVAAGFGAWVVLIFALLHWACDVFWDWFVSLLTFKSRGLWKENTQAIVFGVCGLILIIFGIFFLAMPIVSSL